MLGLLTPVGVVAGRVAGGLIGHFTKGLSRGDMEDLGSALEEGQAALVVVGKSKLDQYLDRMFERAQRTVEKEMKVDRKEFEKDLNEQVKVAQQAAR